MGAILQYGLSVALVGMSTVFVGLIILIGLIKLMEMIMTGGKGKKKAEVFLLFSFSFGITYIIYVKAKGLG